MFLTKVYVHQDRNYLIKNTAKTVISTSKCFQALSLQVSQRNLSSNPLECEKYTGTHTCKCLGQSMNLSGIQSCQRGSQHCRILGHSGHYGITPSRVQRLCSSSRACPSAVYSRLHPTHILGYYIVGHTLCLLPAVCTPNMGRKVYAFDRSAH